MDYMYLYQCKISFHKILFHFTFICFHNLIVKCVNMVGGLTNCKWYFICSKAFKYQSLHNEGRMRCAPSRKEMVTKCFCFVQALLNTLKVTLKVCTH
jgi:hypothetical protein